MQQPAETPASDGKDCTNPGPWGDLAGYLCGCPSRGVVTPGSLSSAVRVERFTQSSALQFVLNQLNHGHLKRTEITFKKAILSFLTWLK